MAHLPSDIGVIWKLLSPGSGLVGFGHSVAPEGCGHHILRSAGDADVITFQLVVFVRKDGHAGHFFP